MPGVDGLSAIAEVHYFDGLIADANNKYRPPSYSLVDRGVSYQTSVARRPATLRAGVDNVSNRNF